METIAPLATGPRSRIASNSFALRGVPTASSSFHDSVARARRGRRDSDTPPMMREHSLLFLLSATFFGACSQPAKVTTGHGELAPRAAQADTPPPTMRVHFIDVGQGASTLFEFPHDAVLVDTGGEQNAYIDSTKALTAYLDDFFTRRTDLDGHL